MLSLSPKYSRFLSIFPLLSVVLLGHIDTAQAQGTDTFNFSPSTYTFTSPVGGAQLSQVVNVTSTAAPLAFTLSYSSPQNWLTAYQNGSTTPASFTIFATPGQLAVGTYSGSVTLTPPTASATPQTFSVSLIVGPTTNLTASPTSLSFTAATGSTQTAVQTVGVTSPSNNVNFTAGVTYAQNNVANWLAVSPTSGVTNSTLAIAANPAGLAAGTYAATVTLTASQSAPVLVNVTFIVTGQPTITTNLSSIPFYYQINQSPTAFTSTSLSIGSGSVSAVPIAVSTTTSSCPGWLSISQQGELTTPATVQVFANNVASIPAGTECDGTVTITSPSVSNSPYTIPVKLLVSNSPFVVITPSTASFAYQSGGALPANQNLTITSTSTSLPFTASSNQTWLTVTPSGSTGSNSQIQLSLMPSQLTALIPGTYQAMVSVSVPGAANSSIQIPVTLTVSANAVLTLSTQTANFVYQVGQQLPNSQTIGVGSTGGQIPFSITPTTTGPQFFSVSPLSGVTNSSITIQANPASLSPGTYTGTISVFPINGNQNQSPQLIQVTLTVSNTALLNVQPQTLSFSFSQGQTTLLPNQNVVLTSTTTDPLNQLKITSVTPNAYWLSPSLIVGTTTPQTLQVGVNPTVLTPSTTPYTSTLTIAAVNPQNQTSTATVQVTLTYNSGITLTVSPASLTFAQTANGSAPAAQTITLGATGASGANINYSVTSATLTGGNWITVSNTSGTAPGTVSIGVNSIAASLAPGTYTGSVTIYGSGAANPNGTLTIPITLNVTASATLVASPVALTFSGNVAAGNPATQTLAITASNSVGPVQFTAAATTASGGNWLSVTPASGATPGNLAVTANLAGLAQGTYNGTVTLTPAGGGAATTVQVAFTVGGQITPSVTQVINAASGVSGSIAPGEIVSIFGANIGPAAPAGLTLTPQGGVSTTLSGVGVTFNGIAAPLTYVSATQINCVVPFEVAGSATAQMQISYNGVTSGATAINVVGAQPGIFTQNASGSGQGAILLPNYTVVSPSNAAPRGTAIVVYATGGGQTTPASVTGAVAGNTLLNTNVMPTVTIGGVTSTVLYAGSAPGLVEGVLQINVMVPSTISAGNQPILITVGSNTSQNNVQVAVQ